MHQSTPCHLQDIKFWIMQRFALSTFDLTTRNKPKNQYSAIQKYRFQNTVSKQLSVDPCKSFYQLYNLFGGGWGGGSRGRYPPNNISLNIMQNCIKKEVEF